MIIFLHHHQKLTFNRMSTPQCHEINVMTFDTECHEICFVGRKTNVMTLMSWDLENVMRFSFSGTGPRSSSIMMTTSNGNIFRVTGPLCWEFTGHRLVPPLKYQWRGALMFSLICVWTNGWVINRDAGDLRRHCAHYDVIVMILTKQDERATVFYGEVFYSSEPPQFGESVNGINIILCF